jgi:hypothetical protein
MVQIKKRKAATKKTPKKKPKTTKSRSVIDRIGEIDFSDESYSINIYGKSATGKTTLWSTFPSPILAVICSGGKRSGELRSLDTKANRKRIKQVVVHNTDEIRELIDYQEEEEPFKTIVLDHATGLQDFVLRELLGITKIPEQGSWGMADRQVWGECTSRTKEILRGFLELECYRVIVAQERTFGEGMEDEDFRPYIASALTPSLVGWLLPACDYVVNTFIQAKTTEKVVKIRNKQIKKQVKVKGEVDYCLRVGPSGDYATKFRVPKGHKFPEYLIDPTHTKIEQLLIGG